MLKVFLVEDEIVVRESIRENFPWDEYGFSLAGEAADGEMALPVIEELRPDIVVTDIRMPFMNGLELSRLLKKSMPWMKIIIISGHDEFSYAQEAISIGVNDYILKPISSEDLLTVLKKVEDEIKQEEEQRRNLEQMKKASIQYTDYEKERFLNDLSSGVYTSSSAVEKANKIGLDIMARYYCVSLISIWNKGESPTLKESLQIRGIINELAESNESILTFRVNAKEMGLVFIGNVSNDVEEEGYNLSRSIKAEAEKRTSCEIRISIGSVRERISGIHESMNDARIASGFDYIFGSNSIVGIDDTRRLGGGNSLRFDSGAKGLLHFLKTGNPSEIEEITEKALVKLGENGAHSIYYAFAFTEIISTISGFIVDLGGEPEKALPGLDRFLELITRDRKKLYSYKVFLSELLSSALRFREGRKESRYGDLIQNARRYINENYVRSDLALSDVAGEVNISPGHFSTIFSQETGSTFIEYLTKVRIDRACELLKTGSLKSSEIAYEVGYNDSHYFFHIFKKRTGETPKSFRNKV